MVDFLGPDYFWSVISVDLEGCRTGEALPLVARVHCIESLSLVMTEVNVERTSHGLALHISSKRPDTMLDHQ
jgi:hypothetical protein